MSQPPDNWASEMQALQDQIENLQLELDCAKRNEATVTYWQGMEDGMKGAATRWAEALTEPIPKAGTMQEPLESLYRHTEKLRQERDTAVSDIEFVRGQRNGYVYVLTEVIDTVNRHWVPHDDLAQKARGAMMARLLGLS